MEKKNLILVLIVVGAMLVLGLVLGLVFGLKKYDEDDDENKLNVLNSYSNTDELIKKYPVINPTEILDGIEKNIQNRLLTGFENWNRGFDTWKAWGNILYTNDSIYNVHGARLSLASYQKAMDISLQRQTILMGDFHNMLIIDNFAGIHYDFLFGPVEAKKEELTKSRVMEFVNFKDYGVNLGTRVVEGWGSTKDEEGEGLKLFQGEKEKREQEIQEHFFLKNYNIPNTTDLNEKYFIMNPTTYKDENAKDILQLVLEGFDSWNNGLESYITFINKTYDDNAISSSLDERNRTMDEYRKEMKDLFTKKKIEKLYFDNILIRDNWTGLHFRYRSLNLTSNEISVGDRMQFLKFEQKGQNLTIIGSWIQ